MRGRIIGRRAEEREGEEWEERRNPNGQDYARLKPSAQNSVQVPHVGYTVPGTSAIFFCFPRTINRNLNQKYSSWNLSWHIYWILVLQIATLCAVPQH